MVVLLTLQPIGMSNVVAGGGIRPSYALMVAGGKTLSRPWRVWAFGINGERCLDAFTVFRSYAREDQACESPREPEAAWSEVMSPKVGSSKGAATLAVFVARPTVSRLGLIVEALNGTGQRQVWLQVRVPGRHEGVRAHLRQSAGFAAGILPGKGCIVQVIVRDPDGESVEPGPCTPPGGDAERLRSSGPSGA